MWGGEIHHFPSLPFSLSLLTTNHPGGAQSYADTVLVKQDPSLVALCEHHDDDALLRGQRHGL